MPLVGSPRGSFEDKSYFRCILFYMVNLIWLGDRFTVLSLKTALNLKTAPSLSNAVP